MTAGQFLLPLVSILYEADRLCNLRKVDALNHLPPVSILYEADRLCNVLPVPGGPWR